MKIDKSKKNGKKGFLNKHHIIPKWLKSKHKETIKLTVEQHAEIHHLIDGITDPDEIYSIYFQWLRDKKNNA